MITICEYNVYKGQLSIDLPLLTELTQLEFFAFAEQAVEPLLGLMRASGELFVDAIYRSFFLDEEDVFEQGISVIFASAASVLAVRGLKIPAFNERALRGGSYTVLMGNMSYKMIPSASETNTAAWHRATLIGLRALGDTLERGGCSEQIYFDPGSGNDGTVFLLTEAMFTFLEERKVFSRVSEELP
jgi:hypothetical protein